MRSTTERAPAIHPTSSPAVPHPVLSDLTDARLREMYQTMLLSRLIDERTWILNRQGRVPFTISCQGHEAAQVGSAFAFEPGRDIVFPYYRDVGVVLRMGMTAHDLMLAVFARAADPASGGRQMPNHFSSPTHRIISVSSPVATQITQGAGAALASKIRGEPEVTAVYFGEGCTSSGHFHEGLNVASIHALPVVFICENNGWAISVPREKQMAVRSVADRACAYGMPGVEVDGCDPRAMYLATREAVDRARSGGGPTLIDARVCRLTPHSSDDDDRRYRSAEELDLAKKRDPLTLFRRALEEEGLLTSQSVDALRAQAAALVDDAVAFAEASPEPDPSTLRRHLFKE